MFLVHGAAHGLGLQAYMRDFGIDFFLIIEPDSSSAEAFASRRGLGQQRHVQTSYLWIQDMVATNSFVVILTKVIDRKTFDRHLKKSGFVEVQASKLHKQA